MTDEPTDPLKDLRADPEYRKIYDEIMELYEKINETNHEIDRLSAELNRISDRIYRDAGLMGYSKKG